MLDSAMTMRLRQTAVPRLLLALALVGLAAAGCDRGGQPGQLGQPAPEFRVTDGATTLDLASYRGQVVLLNFWATWCAPCVEELPSLEALQQDLPAVRVLAVSTDDDRAAYQLFLVRHNVQLTTVEDAAQASNALYGTHRFPETYIIDKAGVVRRKLIGPQDFTSPELVAYLKKLAA